MNADQKTKLATELAKPEYTGLADYQAKADYINTTASPDKFRKVEYNDVVAYLTYREKIVGIKNAAATNAFAEELLFLAIQTKLERFDLNLAPTATSVNRLLDGLVAATLIDAADKTFILSMADMPISEALGLGTVKWNNIRDIEVGA